jgi:hypothetical protein
MCGDAAGVPEGGLGTSSTPPLGEPEFEGGRGRGQGTWISRPSPYTGTRVTSGGGWS